MRNLCRVLTAALAVALTAVAASAQRAPVLRDPADPQQQPAQEVQKSPIPATPPAPAPASVVAKYEGGIFGYNHKIDGTLNFDDVNRRLLFRDKKLQRETFSIPYDAVAAAFADTRSKRPIAADVVGRASLYTLPALLIKKKFRYLTLQYRDPDTQAAGITSFKLQNKEILNSVLATLAGKAGLTQRGEIYVRRRDSGGVGTSTMSTTVPIPPQP